MEINRTLRSAALTLALTLGLLGLSSCDDEGGDHVLPPSFEQDDDSVDGSLGNLSGTVTIQASSPANAAVVVGDVTGHPDQTGRFFLPGLAVENDVAWFRFNPQSSTFTCRPVHLTSGVEIHLPDVWLLKVDRYGVVFRNGAGGTVTVAGSWGSSATFADSSFTRGGAVFVGSCAPYVAVATADQAHFAAAFPGEFRGVRSDETESAPRRGRRLLDFGRRPGPRLPGPRARDGPWLYRLGVDVAGGAPAPASVLVWTLDTTTGRWHEAGEATLAGNTLRGGAPHARAGVLGEPGARHLRGLGRRPGRRGPAAGQRHGGVRGPGGTHAAIGAVRPGRRLRHAGLTGGCGRRHRLLREHRRPQRDHQHGRDLPLSSGRAAHGHAAVLPGRSDLDPRLR